MFPHKVEEGVELVYQKASPPEGRMASVVDGGVVFELKFFPLDRKKAFDKGPWSY